MGIIGIGVDIVHLPRIVALINRRSAEKVATRILSQREQCGWAALDGQNELQKARFLGVRWCLKEATYKALYPIYRPTWKEVTYQSLDPVTGCKPTLLYHPDFVTEQAVNLHSSVSHDGDYIFSTVIAET